MSYIAKIRLQTIIWCLFCFVAFFIFTNTAAVHPKVLIIYLIVTSIFFIGFCIRRACDCVDLWAGYEREKLLISKQNELASLRTKEDSIVNPNSPPSIDL
jgi:hypothetical protein